MPSHSPARFWRHGVAALDQVRPGLAERVGPLLGPPAPASYEGLVTALINELAAGPDADQALLVLDDYHLIDSAAVHSSLGFLLEHRPPGLRLVLASRSDPPLALAARTEGWAAGLQLAALSLHGQPDAAGFVAAFTGSHRYVLDFLTEEVLEQQSDQVRTFLLETSVLERLSGPLCDAVTGRPAGSGCWNRWSGPGCSWCRSMRCAAGGATTSCSLTCSGSGCSRNSPAGFRNCTVTRRAGTPSAGLPMTRSGTR